MSERKYKQTYDVEITFRCMTSKDYPPGKLAVLLKENMNLIAGVDSFFDTDRYDERVRYGAFTVKTKVVEK